MTCRFLFRNVAARLEYFGHHLRHFDLSTDNTQIHDMPMQSPNQPGWPDPMTFWARMLEHMPKLESLRLHDARERFEPRKEENLDLNMLFNCIEMPSVQLLQLKGWAVTPEIMMEKLLWAFPKLKLLDLETLDMRSNEDDCWSKALKKIKEHYGNISIGPLVGLRQRNMKGKDKDAYVKHRLKRQRKTEMEVDDVWNKVADGQ